jgi:hypothetical protein
MEILELEKLLQIGLDQGCIFLHHGTQLVIPQAAVLGMFGWLNSLKTGGNLHS